MVETRITLLVTPLQVVLCCVVLTWPGLAWPEEFYLENEDEQIAAHGNGTGYSSLSQLQQPDLDVGTVDRAFTSPLSRSAQGVAFFCAIVSMAHVPDVSVVTEGVETEGALRLLRDPARDEVQALTSRARCRRMRWRR